MVPGSGVEGHGRTCKSPCRVDAQQGLRWLEGRWPQQMRGVTPVRKVAGDCESIGGQCQGAAGVFLGV